MAPDSHNKLRQIFDAAIVLPLESRAEFVRLACGTDQVLRQQILDLLAAHQNSADFLEATPATQSLSFADDGPTVGSVGPYRLLRQVGQGGMGTVYQAVRSDDTFRKIVAIKVLRPDASNEDFVRRFRQERQILATLDHPNIARILDGGTTDNHLPYYVMDFVEGQPINRHCDAQRLSLASRLRLLRQVCGAVQYLHENHVIHRDLKPSNILVTADGTAKLLDFGIAKIERLGEPQTIDIAGAGRLMTPKYASPEQRCGEPVGKASDIYALGVILYELVTGRHPFADDPPDEALAQRRAPAKPSLNLREDLQRMPETTGQLRRRVAGDLDQIVLKALNPAPSQRYASAAEFSEDLQRYLDGRPVLARHTGVTGRVVKFVRRNRLAVAAVVLVALIIVLGAWQAVEARIQHARADAAQNMVAYLEKRLPIWATLTPEQQLEDVHRVSTLLCDLREKNPGSNGSANRNGVVEGAERFLDHASELTKSPDVARGLASSYATLAEVRRQDGTPAGRKAAIENLTKSETILSGYPDDAAAKRQLDEVRAARAAVDGTAQPKAPVEVVTAEPVKKVATSVRPAPAKSYAGTAEGSQSVTPNFSDPEPRAPAVTVKAPPDPALVDRYNHADSSFQAEQPGLETIRQANQRRGLGGLSPGLERAIAQAKACLTEASIAINNGEGERALQQLRCAEAETRNIQRLMGR